MFSYTNTICCTRFRYFFHQPSWENHGTFSSQLMGKVPRARARARARAGAGAGAGAGARARF